MFVRHEYFAYIVITLIVIIANNTLVTHGIYRNHIFFFTTTELSTIVCFSFFTFASSLYRITISIRSPSTSPPFCRPLPPALPRSRSNSNPMVFVMIFFIRFARNLGQIYQMDLKICCYYVRDQLYKDCCFPTEKCVFRTILLFGAFVCVAALLLDCFAVRSFLRSAVICSFVYFIFCSLCSKPLTVCVLFACKLVDQYKNKNSVCTNVLQAKLSLIFQDFFSFRWSYILPTTDCKCQKYQNAKNELNLITLFLSSPPVRSM